MKKKLKALAILIPAVVLCIAGYCNFNELAYSTRLNQKIIEVSGGTHVFYDSGKIADFVKLKDGTPDYGLHATEVMLNTEVKTLYLKYLDAKQEAAMCWLLLIVTALTFGGLLRIVTIPNSDEKDKNPDGAA